MNLRPPGYEAGVVLGHIVAYRGKNPYISTGFSFLSALIKQININLSTSFHVANIKHISKTYNLRCVDKVETFTLICYNTKWWYFMNLKLFAQAMLKFLLGVILVGLLVFLPAGSVGFANGWLFMGILFVPMFFAGIVMLFKNPDLLKKRLNAKEKQKEQDLVVKLSGLMFLVGFIVAGLNFRFGWHVLPKGAVVAASVLFLFSYLLYAEVLRENAYLSRTIEVQENQKVVDTGLYGIVRHPMYSATLLLFLSMPIVLGSVISFVIFLAYPLIIAKRIKNEEAFLEKELDGYKEYKQKVKYRLVPFVW